MSRKPLKPYRVRVNAQGETKEQYQARRSNEAATIIAEHGAVMTQESEAELVGKLNAAGFVLEARPDLKPVQQ